MSTDLAALATTFSFILLAAVLIFRFFGKYLPVPRQLRVPPFKAGVFLFNDKPERVVGPGTYWVTPKRDILTCDTRPTSYKTQPEDFLTADNFGLRISLTGQYRIADPVAFLTTSSNADGAFFLELAQTLRAATHELSGQSLLRPRHSARPPAAAYRAQIHQIRHHPRVRRSRAIRPAGLAQSHPAPNPHTAHQHPGLRPQLGARPVSFR